MRSNWTLTVSVLGLGLVSIPGILAQENHYISLPEVPTLDPGAVIIPTTRNDPHPETEIGGPEKDLDFRDLVAVGIVKDPKALIRSGKALFWDMQAGSDAVQACASCHFNAGADIRSKNQISSGLADTEFEQDPKPPGLFISGDNNFGNSTVPYTANDRHTPNPPGPRNPPLPTLMSRVFRHSRQIMS